MGLFDRLALDLNAHWKAAFYEKLPSVKEVRDGREAKQAGKRLLVAFLLRSRWLQA